MITDVPDQTTADSVNEAPQPVRTRRLTLRSKQVRIATLLLVVMAVEASVLALLVPQPAHSQAKATGEEERNETDDTTQTDLNIDTAEVTIGKFSCTNNRAATGSIHLSFELVAVVSAGQAAKFDQAANGDNGVHKHRVRQAVEKVARSSNLDDLNDPNLSTMKRLIREEINKVLQKSYIIEVVISEFRTMEQ